MVGARVWISVQTIGGQAGVGARAAECPARKLIPSGHPHRHAPAPAHSRGWLSTRGLGAVPIAVSPGRTGFGPELSLTYDSGAGNGPFGFGWRERGVLRHNLLFHEGDST